MNGVLAARGRWRLVALLLAGDQVVRLVAVLAVLSVGGGTEGLLWAVAAGTFVWLPLVGSRQARDMWADRGDRAIGGFLRLAGVAMASTSLSALLVAGYPMLVEITTAHPLGDRAGAIFAAILLTRAPLLVPLYGLRPLVLSWFLDRGDRVRRACAAAALAGAGATLVGMAGAAAVGRPVLQLLFGSQFEVSRALLAAVAGGAGLMGLMTVAGIALISLDRHVHTTVGWLVALVVSVAVMSIPGSLETQVVAPMLAGPSCGLLWQFWAIGRASVQPE